MDQTQNFVRNFSIELPTLLSALDCFFYSLKVKQFVQSIIEHVLFKRISIPFQIQSKENEKAGENWNGSTKIFLDPNWHEGGHFPTPLLFGSEFVSRIFFKKFQTFLEVKIDTNRVTLTLCQAHWGLLPLSGAKDAHFSCFHSSCQLGLKATCKSKYVALYVSPLWPGGAKEGQHNLAKI